MRAKVSELALYGGPKVRRAPWPGRHLFGPEEKEAVMALFDQAISSGHPFGYNGPAEEAYCQEFAAHLGGGYADGVSSGTAAVYVALRALDLPPYSEVIVSPITDPGGMMPIPLLNLIPVVADAAPGSYNTGPEQIEALITPLTRAILVAHIGGEPADMEGILAVARRHGLLVVEDVAQAHGARLNGRPLGTFGDIAAFSTMYGKHHATGGQGGVVFTRSEELYWRVRQAADRGKPFGRPAGATNGWASLNFNLDELGATIGRVQLKKLPQIVGRRREVVQRLTEAFQQLESVFVPPLLPGAEASYWFWRLGVRTERLTCDKETFCRALAAEGLPITPRYNAMPHTMEWFRERRVFGTSGLPWSSPQYQGDRDRTFPCPNALAALDTHFNLGVHEGWGEQEIADTIAAFRKVEAAFLA